VSESVQLATIWLVDLVGSTRLASSVGPVRADELMREYFGLLREAVEASGGTEFKDTGDGLFVAFSSASAGVSCAVLTQQLFEWRYRGKEQQLHVRIGLGTGESTLRDGGWAGMPSIEAARLCDKAPADGILISSATKMLAGRVDCARFESFGEIELKGIPEPMEAFSVIWEPFGPEQSAVEVGRWPVPEALRVVPRIAYVGREFERRLLEIARNRARSAARQVVLLSGEPGIGKTRLASHAALEANADGFAVCWGVCSEDLAAPYEPWLEVCSQLVEHAPEDVLASYLPDYGGEISWVARTLRRRAAEVPARQSSDPETERFLLYKAVAQLLRAVAASQPLCVVLDDFHWADGQSVALLKHVVRGIEHVPLLILVAYRDSDLSKDHPLTGVLADLRPIDGIERVGLTGLGAGEVAEFMRAAAGHDLDEAGLGLASQISAETGGNPFFVGEILRSLTESGAVTFDQASGRWSVEQGAATMLPESVREVIDRRIDRLGGEARGVLRAAAVIGRSFDVALLVRLVELDERRLLDQLEAAVDATLLRESSEHVGQFAFAHALINDTLYQGLGATRRARIHQQVAEALEQLHGTDSEEHLAELALHWRLATVSVDRTRAVGYSLRAGRRALHSLAPSEAVKLFGDALELVGQSATVERCEALVGLGDAQRQSGAPTHRETLLAASRLASQLGDAGLAARAALANNRGFVSGIGAVDVERVAAIERALELDDPPQAARRARLLSLLGQEFAFAPDHHQRRRLLADEAVALARQASDERTLAAVLEKAWNAHQGPDLLARRADYVRELNALVIQVRDLRTEFFARWCEFWTETELCEFARADAALERMRVIAEQTRLPTFRWIVGYQAGAVACRRGELAAGERLAEQALQIGQRAGEVDAIMIYSVTLIENRTFQGRGAEVIALLEQAVGNYPGLPAWEAELSRMYCYIDRRSDGREMLARATAKRFDHLPHDSARMCGLAMYSDTAAQTSSAEAAAMLYSLLEPYAEQFIWNGGAGYGHTRMSLALLSATLGRHQQADAHFRFACDFHSKHSQLVWEARSELGWAEALADRGETDRARDHAAHALEISRAQGYGAFEPRAAAVLEATSAVN
jgi:class 3 adenylate cyclase